jgi:hypothetical protein
MQAVSLLVMSWTGNPVVATVFFGALSLGMGLVFGLNATTIQQVTPDFIRGRVMSVSGMMFSGVMPFATILVGAAVELLTIRIAFGLCGVLYLAVAGALLLRSGIIGRAPESLIAAPESRSSGMPAAAAGD